MTQLSGAHATRRFLRQLKFCTGHFQVICPNIGKKFVKLYAELQKLHHLTCSKLKM